ncbi:MAG: hypothetical protein ACREOO_19720 [bacterium]
MAKKKTQKPRAGTVRHKPTTTPTTPVPSKAQPSRKGAQAGLSPLAAWIAQHPALVVAGVLTVIIFAFFFEIVFQGKTYLSPDAQTPVAVTTPLKKMHEQDGVLPQWVPYLFAGMPSLGSLVYAPYSYFPNIALAPIGRFVRGTVIMVWYYVLAGFGLYLFLRRKGAGYIPALFGGIAFMLMPYLITMFIFGHGSQMMTAAYIPLALWAVDRLLEKFSPLNLGLAGVIMGFMLQRGHIQIAYYGLMLLGFYLLYHVFIALRQKQTARVLPMLGGFLGAVAIAFALAAVLFLPLREYTPYSIRGSASVLEATAEKTDTGVGFDYATQWSLSPGEMMTFVLPSFYGFGGFTYWGDMPFTDYPNYMGILVLALALAALIKRVPLAGFFGISILLALLISFGRHFAWFYNIFYDYFPYFNKFRVPSMILILVQCSTAILAGLGLQALLQPLAQKADRETSALRAVFVKRLWTVLIAVFAIMLLITLSRSVSFEWMRGFYPDQYEAQTQIQLDSKRFSMLLADLWIVGLIFCAGLSMLALAYSKKISTTTAATVITLLTLLDLWIVDKRISPEPVPDKSFSAFLQPDEATRFVQADQSVFRIFPVEDLFDELRWSAQAIASVGGYHPAKPRRYQDLIEATQLQSGFVNDYFRTVNQNGRRALQPFAAEEVPRARHRANRRLLDLLNVKYIFSFYPLPEADSPAGGWIRRRVVNYERDGNARPLIIYENPSVLPRAYMVGQYESSQNDRETLGRLRAGDFDPHRTVILSEEPATPPQPDSTARAEIKTYELHNIVVETDCRFPQILVLSDNYYPICWKASIDGQPARTLRANHAFSAVEIPPGKHMVEFRYASSAFTTGALASAGALLVAAGCMGLGWRNERRREGEGSP